MLHGIGVMLSLFGVDVSKMGRAVMGTASYFSDLLSYIKQKRAVSDSMSMGLLYPCTADKKANSGQTGGHYFHQDLWVARRVHDSNPARHIDVGSRVDGFVAHVAAFRCIEVMDVRPLGASIPNVTFIEADFMRPLPDSLVECCDSLSCLHAVEHFGLGRYGDPVVCDGHLLGLENLHKCLKRGGTLYLSAPIGPLRVEFNAHRVFSVEYLLGLLEGKYEIRQFSYIDDAGAMHENVSLGAPGVQNNFGCRFGCGVFEMTKL